MTVNCILAGVGGQGTILASKLIAHAAMNGGKNVRTAETIGMAQRGGSVVSHVRMGETIYSPMVPKHSADIIIGFEPAETVRCLPYLKDGGAVIVNQKAIRPFSDALGNSSYIAAEILLFLQNNTEKLIIVDGDSICTACESSRVLNVALLGAAAASGMLGLTISQIETAINERVPAHLIEANIKALRLGAKTSIN